MIIQLKLEGYSKVRIVEQYKPIYAVFYRKQRLKWKHLALRTAPELLYGIWRSQLAKMLCLAESSLFSTVTFCDCDFAVE